MANKLIFRSDFDWETSSDSTEFECGLQELGLPAEVVADMKGSFDHAVRAMALKTRHTKHSFKFQDPEGYAWHRRVTVFQPFWNKIKELLASIDRRVEKTTYQVLRIPVFQLHSPSIARCRVAYKEKTTDSIGSVWQVKVFGSGTGKTCHFAVKNSSSFESSAGECKLIFAPIRMKIEQIATYRNGKLLGHGVRTEAVGAGRVYHRAVMLLPTDACCKATPCQDTPGEIFDLRFESTKAVGKYESSWMAKSDTNLEVAFDVPFAKGKCKASVSQSKEVSLTCELPGGYAYWMQRLKDKHGIRWWVESPK